MQPQDYQGGHEQHEQREDIAIGGYFESRDQVVLDLKQHWVIKIMHVVRFVLFCIGELAPGTRRLRFHLRMLKVSSATFLACE